MRIGALAESGLIARKLASDRIVIAASPAYLSKHGTPTTPAELVHHNCLSYVYSTSGDDWKMSGPGGVHSVKTSGSLRATNGDMIKLAGVGGVGLIRQPLFLIAEDLRAGRLVEVLGQYKADELGIYAIYPSRKHLSAKVRTFVDFLAEAFALKSEW